MQVRRQQLSLEQALQKARHYCAYQERCHSEVKEKLYGFGLRRQAVEEALSRLIEENYLNEERFCHPVRRRTVPDETMGADKNTL